MSLIGESLSSRIEHLIQPIVKDCGGQSKYVKALGSKPMVPMAFIANRVVYLSWSGDKWKISIKVFTSNFGVVLRADSLVTGVRWYMEA